jgi:hypothetical protein
MSDDGDTTYGDVLARARSAAAALARVSAAVARARDGADRDRLVAELLDDIDR